MKKSYQPDQQHITSRALYWARAVVAHCAPSDRARLIGALAFACTTLIPAILAPLLFAALIDRVSHQGDGNYIIVILLGIGFLLLRLVGQALLDLRFILINPILYRIVYRYAEDLVVGRLEGRKTRGVRYNRIADVSEKIIVVERSQIALMNLAYGMIVVVIPSAIEIGFTLVVASVVLGPVSAGGMIAGMLAICLSLLYSQTSEAKSFANATEADNKCFREIGQVLGYSALIREFDAQLFFRKRLLLLSESANRLHESYFWIKSKRSLLRSFVMTCSVGFVLVLAVVSPTSGTLSPGNVFLVLWYVDRLFIPLASIAATMVGIENAVVNLESAEDIHQRPEPLAVICPLRTFDDRVHIILPPDLRDACACDSIHLRPGTRVALSGRSGSGKTTILTELYESAALSNNLRIYYCPERPLVVEGSVLINLGFGREDDASIPLWIEFWDDYMKRPGPLLTQAADTLSAGEMQLLGILRACSRRPEILIIDEGLSAMDRQLEDAVMQFVSNRLPDAITFLVSHRLIPAFAPQIKITMADGKIKRIETVSV